MVDRSTRPLSRQRDEQQHVSSRQRLESRQQQNPNHQQPAAWSPYPDHSLTLWAVAPNTKEVPLSHLDADLAPRHKKRLQWWQISRNFNTAGANKGRTTDVLATHKLNFGNQSICKLFIPLSAIDHLDGLVELRMPQNKLRTLPPALFRLSGLEILNLERNQLDEYCAPERQWQGLKHLRVLFLAGNRFRQLPPSIGRMQRLFYLDASDNPHMDCLPVELLTSPTIATLTVKRCSPVLAQALQLARARAPVGDIKDRPVLPFADPIADGPGARHVRVPPLAAMCAQRLARAASIPPEMGLVSQSPEVTSWRHLRAACEELRQHPEDHHPLPDLMRRASDAEAGQCLCSVCERLVYYSSFSFLELADGCELPVAWRCCSARCRSVALASGVPRDNDT
ncbi:leucine-rich repeats and IQ motif containing protein 4 [Coemansia biformis]|uniref:Leucine-rich repeats and IQ motif containing protein 4 n=1 Tax=Coemansia biformis TaxID=1286918 RepID=A0A9W8CZY7_9FUNG|nr:leucine-rich repeats and IQ motif containing protein 4 [Coemansia biformis]